MLRQLLYTVTITKRFINWSIVLPINLAYTVRLTNACCASLGSQWPLYIKYDVWQRISKEVNNGNDLFPKWWRCFISTMMEKLYFNNDGETLFQQWWRCFISTMNRWFTGRCRTGADLRSFWQNRQTVSAIEPCNSFSIGKTLTSIPVLYPTCWLEKK